MSRVIVDINSLYPGSLITYNGREWLVVHIFNKNILWFTYQSPYIGGFSGDSSYGDERTISCDKVLI